MNVFDKKISEELEKTLKKLIRIKAKENDNMVHCLVCHCNYSKQGWNHHMKTKKHIKNFNTIHNKYCNSLSYSN